MPSLLSNKARAALVDIRENTAAVNEFLDGMERRSFDKDKKTFYAVTRALEIISEASRRIPEEVRSRHPDIAWHAIRDAGNVYRHGYDQIERHLVWETARNDLDALVAMVEAELAADAADRQIGHHDP